MLSLQESILRLSALLPALTIHEFAHAYSAYRFGDPTPKMEGRLSLNPLNHLDPIGTLMILFGPVGWAKPVRVNPYNMRHPARHLMLSTACGPLANIIQGIIFGLLARTAFRMLPPHMVMDTLLKELLILLVFVPFSLAFFNLIPLGVLDGHEVLAYFLPYKARASYERFNHRYGMLALIGLILVSNYFFDILGLLLLPAYWLTVSLIW